ncbi:hypothetical protein ACHAXR_000282 [Thalassiosira sp. AJA248-18]
MVANRSGEIQGVACSSKTPTISEEEFRSCSRLHHTGSGVFMVGMGAGIEPIFLEMAALAQGMGHGRTTTLCNRELAVLQEAAKTREVARAHGEDERKGDESKTQVVHRNRRSSKPHSYVLRAQGAARHTDGV